MISNTEVLPAPQANMIAAVSRGLLEDAANQPWLLYGLGGFVAVMLYMAGVPMLAFALGMYISIPINMAVLAGALVSYIVGKTGRSEKVKKASGEQGVLIASGLMAGGAIFGIVRRHTAWLTAVGAPIRFMAIGEEFWLEQTAAGEPFLRSKAADWFKGAPGQGISLAMFIGLAVVCFWLAKKGAECISARKRRRRGEHVSFVFCGRLPTCLESGQNMAGWQPALTIFAALTVNGGRLFSFPLAYPR